MASAGAEIPETATISILNETSNRVELAIRIPDLQRKKGLARWMQCGKRRHPQELVANATFTRWVLTASSLEYEAKIRQNHSDQTSVSKILIRQFPSDIDDQAIDVRHPPGRNYSFLIITARKKPPAADWKRFLSENGTLDACCVEEESPTSGKEKESTEREQGQTEGESTGCGVYQEPLKKSW